MEALSIIAGSGAFCFFMTAVVLGVLVAITVNRQLSADNRKEERKLNIDAEASRLKRIGDRTGQYEAEFRDTHRAPVEDE